MGRTQMGCCFEEERVCIRIGAENPDGTWKHVEKLKNRAALGVQRGFERFEKAVYKINNNNWDMKIKFALHIEDGDKIMAYFVTTMNELKNKHEFGMDWVDPHFDMGGGTKSTCKFG
jgi:hypothetical protein